MLIYREKYHGKQDLCRDFGSSVPDSQRRRNIMLNSFQYNTKFLWFKKHRPNKANKSKNIKHNLKFTFPHQKKVAKRHWPYTCDTPLNAYWRQISVQQSTKISEKLKKSQKQLKSEVLSRTSRNWCTNPIHVLHLQMRIDVSYNKYVLNNPQKYQKSWKHQTVRLHE
jgi:hypothetical protein